MKILNAIITCDKNRSLQDAIRETYAKNSDKYIFVGDSNSSDVVSFPSLPVGYVYVPFKLAYFLMCLDDFNDFDFIMISDDDTYVDINALKIEIESLKISPDEKACLGHIFYDYTEKHALEQGMPLQSLRGKDCNLPVTYPSGGAGFVITRACFSAIKEYLLENKDFPTAYNSDISIGFWFRNSGGCKLIHTNKFCTGNIESFGTDEKITFHYMKPEMMRRIHALREKNENR